MTTIIASLIVGASILSGAYLLRPLTPTDKCWDIAETVIARKAKKDPAFEFLTPQEVYANCLLQTRGN